MNSKKKAAAGVESAAAKPITPKLVVPTQSSTSPLEEISDLVHQLPIQACVVLFRRLLTSVSSLPTGAARLRAVLKTVISLWPNIAARPRRARRSKPLGLACWNANGVRGRKLELEHFPSQHGVVICLLSEIVLNSGQAYGLANCVFHRTDRPTDSEGGTAKLVRVVLSNTQCPFRAIPTWRLLPSKSYWPADRY
jgi:hypothetical protein